MIKICQMVLKGEIWEQNDKLGQMVLKRVNWIHHTKVKSSGIERS